jgi:hypothetical protein
MASVIIFDGCCPVPSKIIDRRVLNIPQNIIPLNVIPVGHPTGRDKPKDKYNPENIHREKW